MSNKYIPKNQLSDKSGKQNNIHFPGYPMYPVGEDIYNKAHKEESIDPEDITKTKVPNDANGTNNEKGFSNNVSGSDLDIPGSELDDAQEFIGSEDEENNGYSLGGDDHNDLEEDKGE